MLYPITKQQILDSYILVKKHNTSHDEALIIILEFYAHAFGLISQDFRDYVYSVINNNDPIEAYERAMKIIT